MLTRRHIRVKVMQSLFAMKQKESDLLDNELKFLNNSFQQVKVLFLANLDLLLAIKNHAQNVLDLNKSKKLASEAEKNPNFKFVNNSIFKILENNLDFKSLREKHKVNFWDLDSEYVKIIYKDILDSEIYQEYMSVEETSFKADRKFILDIFKSLVAPNDKLFDYYEDKVISWVDDIPIVNTAIITFIKKIKTDSDESLALPGLVKDQDDILFAHDLFRKTKLHEKALSSEIDGRTPNWDKERIATLDQLIIQLGICEFKYFPSVPVKVTINEYLEIAKEYSTPKSSVFINGILDKVSKEYQKNGTLNKIGRGLL